MMAAAMANLVTAITRGWADVNPILVAVEADAHNTAKLNPAPNHAAFSFLFLIID
jgi:hypothetical protein